MERTVVEVSTEGGWMEQLRERIEPDTNIAGTVTVTIGLGTEVERRCKYQLERWLTLN